MNPKLSSDTPESRLRVEFNSWATSGRGEEMAAHHLPIVLPMLERMQPGPRERWLDLGCGSGWLMRMLAERYPQAEFTGVDISDAMIERARQAAGDRRNLRFLAGSAGRIPAQAQAFTRVVSVESAYYWPDPARAAREIRRVLAARGEAWVLINYYDDNPFVSLWRRHLPVEVHRLSARQWENLFAEAGFTHVRTERIPDPSPTPEVYNGRWFRDAEELKKFKAMGALLIVGAVH